MINIKVVLRGIKSQEIISIIEREFTSDIESIKFLKQVDKAKIAELFKLAEEGIYTPSKAAQPRRVEILSAVNSIETQVIITHSKKELKK